VLLPCAYNLTFCYCARQVFCARLCPYNPLTIVEQRHAKVGNYTGTEDDEVMEDSIYQLIAQINSRVAAIEAQQGSSSSTLKSIQSAQQTILSQLAILVQSVEPPPPAAFLQIIWGPLPALSESPSTKTILFPKETNNMPVSLNPGQTVNFTVAPINAQGGPSTATLGPLTFATSDPTVFSVAQDPNNVNGGIVTALTPATTPDAAALTVTALATEPDGVTTETISGTDTVTVVAVPPPPPPPPVAASLAITWGTVAKKVIIP
jgi:hypothetical protein